MSAKRPPKTSRLTLQEHALLLLLLGILVLGSFVRYKRYEAEPAPTTTTPNTPFPESATDSLP